MTNIEFAKTAYAAFNSVDLAAVLAVLDQAVVWRPASGNPYRPAEGEWIGHDAIVENLFIRLAADWDRFAFHPERFHDAGDAIIVEGRYTGTFRGNGRTLDAAACHVLTVRNHKITRFQQYLDSAQLQDVMGRRHAA